MERINAGVWRCERCNITEQRTSQIEIPLSFPREAFLVAGGNRAGKTFADTRAAEFLTNSILRHRSFVRIRATQK